jgi:glycerophosphoryl diester phosphodiesterase
VKSAAAPLVFAHRGSSAARPEHTLAAYELAIAEGADGLECDVRLTRDGHVVCVHDALIDRTSNGRGRVSAMSLAELDRFSYAPGTDRPVGILTLDRLLTAALAAGRPLQILIETKHPSRFGGAVEEAVIDTLARHGLATAAGMAERGVLVSVMSFSALALRRMRGLGPEVPTVFLFDLGPKAVWEGRTPFGADALGPGINALRGRPDLVRRAHERGHRVYVWTVNQADDIALVLDLGADGIISDRPAEVLRAVYRRLP